MKRAAIWRLARRYLTDAERNAALEKAQAALSPFDSLVLDDAMKHVVKATRNLGTVSMRELLAAVGMFLVEHPD